MHGKNPRSKKALLGVLAILLMIIAEILFAGLVPIIGEIAREGLGIINVSRYVTDWLIFIGLFTCILFATAKLYNWPLRKTAIYLFIIFAISACWIALFPGYQGPDGIDYIGQMIMMTLIRKYFGCVLSISAYIIVAIKVCKKNNTSEH